MDRPVGARNDWRMAARQGLHIIGDPPPEPLLDASYRQTSRGLNSMIEITAVRLAGGSRHPHIAAVLWRAAAARAKSASTSGQSQLRELIDWLGMSPENHAVVDDGSAYCLVAVVRPHGRPPFIRTRADGAWTNALLALPRF
jgi:hypothetical protein